MKAETAERIATMESYGFFVGERDPNRNRNFPGKFMVAQPVEEGDEYPSDDASDGGYCMVGDDFDELINESYEWVDGFIINLEE